MIRCLTLIILIVSATAARGQNSVSDSIKKAFADYMRHCPHEKVYVQTDCSTYMPGDTLWFRAHLVDALYLKQANASRYVYVELITDDDKLVERVKVRPDSIGCFHSYIALDEDLKDGVYGLRAYTRYMRNIGEDYFYHGKISIRKNRDAKKQNPSPVGKFDVSFFPEGGNAQLSTGNIIAFKAVNENGMSENITGKVIDGSGNSVTTFSTAYLGMGMFRMFYMPGKKYYAVCTGKDGVERRFKLPEATVGTVSLRTAWTQNTLRVSLSKSPSVPHPEGLRLVVHVRGVVMFAEEWDKNNDVINFDRKMFPTGIVHLLLTDSRRNILSERLVFSLQDGDFGNTVVDADKKEYSKRERINMSIHVTDKQNRPLRGNFALSVVDGLYSLPDTTADILSSLLISSELKGHIESPASYFGMSPKRTLMALDLLMMTQGWRRYDVARILKGERPGKPEYSVERSDVVTGKAEGLLTSLKNGDISLLAVADSVIGISATKPGEKGRFVFEDLEFPEGTKYIVQAKTKNGKRNVYIYLDPRQEFPTVKNHLVKGDIGLPDETTKTDADDFDYTTLSRRGGMRVINLAEVTVTARRKKMMASQSPYYSITSSMVLTSDDVDKGNFISVLDLLCRIPGLTVTGSEVKHRGETPLVILDDVPKEDFDYDGINVEEVGEIFHTPAISAMPIFGSRAAGGVIIINTKHGFVERHRVSSNIGVVVPVGYRQSVEFYSPRYETDEQRKSSTPDYRTTIYWNPVVSTDENGQARVSFYSADLSAAYRVTLEGVADDGHLITYRNDEAVKITAE